MAVGERKDPFLAFRFLVEISGLIVGGFTEVSGLQMEVETEDYREGGVNDHVYKLPKATRFPNLVLKRGLTDADVFWQWQENVRNGKIERKDIRVILQDTEGNEKWHWYFSEAYPVKWSGPDLKADNSVIALETLEIAHNGMAKI